MNEHTPCNSYIILLNIKNKDKIDSFSVKTQCFSSSIHNSQDHHIFLTNEIGKNGISEVSRKKHESR